MSGLLKILTLVIIKCGCSTFESKAQDKDQPNNAYTIYHQDLVNLLL